ncbi:MAG: hypothetical protein HND48_19490 [Chloroflexi bacterium]|nr:hypothetical protein [Chloroflexota bacterium]
MGVQHQCDDGDQAARVVAHAHADRTAGDRVACGALGIQRVVRRVLDVVNHKGVGHDEQVRRRHGNQP